MGWGRWCSTSHIAARCHSAMWGVLHNTPHDVSHFFPKLSYFVLFFFFLIILVWFLYYCLEAFSSSDFFKFGIFGCLVSIGSNLAQFGVTVVKISRLEERWYGVRNSATPFLKNSFLSQFVIYIVKPFIWEVVETS